MKRPAFQFYPADWRKDSALQSCGISARGLWHEMMCIMHECVPYGHLAINGQPMSNAQLARLVGENERSVVKWLAELKAADVYSVTADGVIYSRRMVNDERIRNARSEAGKLGGNPILLNQQDKPKVNGHDKDESNQEPTPSSSSSSSTSTSENQKPKPANAGGAFDIFYQAYPRKTARPRAEKAWRKLKPDASLLQTMLASIECQKRTEQWQRGVIPHPATWLNDRRWEDQAESIGPQLGECEWNRNGNRDPDAGKCTQPAVGERNNVPYCRTHLGMVN